MGVDINIGQLKKAGSVAERVQSDACLLPFKANSFDSLLCSDVLEHLVNPVQCISEVARVLKNDGIACFTTPCLNIRFSILAPFYRKLIRVDPELIKEHLQVFSDKQLLRMLRHFFRVNELRYVNFTLILERRLGIGYSLDRALSAISSKVPLLHYFAAGVWIKVRKSEQGLHQGRSQE